jgi:hypothetical protein
MSKPVVYNSKPFFASGSQLGIRLKTRSGKIITRLILAAILLYILLNRDISVDVQFSEMLDDDFPAQNSDKSELAVPVKTSSRDVGFNPENTGFENRGNLFTNLPFGSDHKTPVTEAEKRRKMELYVKRYAPIAKSQMRKFGIPASITLAQGLLESDAGESRLAIENNNHFGIKCFSKSCKRGHCTNFTDDSHKDFFRKFENPAESFKAHSQLLAGERYQFLYRYKKTDFSSWAKGLRRAGYATDPNYHEKLIRLIKSLNLSDYDEH